VEVETTRRNLTFVTMSDITIEVEDLRRAYGGQPVLRGLSFTVRTGEIFGLAGANGAGKTTTVEILQGLRRRDGGRVEVLGLDPERDRGRLRPLLGSQLQSSALPDRLRVGEALRLFARLADDRVDWRELSDQWRLGPLQHRPFGTLSGGQRQRLFLALALVNRPRVVFLDELTQGLDPAARQETWRLVEQARDQGATVVIVSHDLDEAERLCDRVAVVADGALLACGRPADLTGEGATATVQFTAPTAVALAGLGDLPGVSEVGFDGAVASVAVASAAVVPLVAELDRRGLRPADLTVRRPSLSDTVVALLTGGSR